MAQIFLLFDSASTRSLGTTNSGTTLGFEIYDTNSIGNITSNTSTSSGTRTGGLDFSDGITYNLNDGIWVGAVSGDGVYTYSSFEDLASNTNGTFHEYTGSITNFNNGIAYNALNGHYYAGVGEVGIYEYASLADLVAHNNPTLHRYGVSTTNFTNGIEFNADTGEWYGAWNAGSNRGRIQTYSTLNDLLNVQNQTATTSTSFDSTSEDFDMGFAIEAVLCLVGDTPILTPRGEVPISELKVGDLVTTLHHGDQPIRWIGKSSFSSAALRAMPKLRPIIIRSEFHNPEIEAENLRLSPQHRVLIQSKIAPRLVGAKQGLIAAKDLLGLAGVSRDDSLSPIDYYHLCCDNHEVIFAQSVPVEMLLLGEEAKKTLTPEAIKELEVIFPDFF